MRRKKKKNSSPVLLILVMLVLAALLLYKCLFVIRSVQVTGTSSISAQEIVRAAELNYGGSIFGVSKEKVRHGIESLGEIVVESIKVQPPSTVVIEVQPRNTAAAMLHMNEVYLTDENGFVIRSAKSLPTGCVYFTGVHITSCKVGSQIAADEGQVELIHSIVTALSAAGGSGYVKEVNIDNINDIYITAINGTHVNVGNSGNLDSKMAWMTAAIADLVQRDQKGGNLDVTSGTKADYSRPVKAAEE